MRGTASETAIANWLRDRFGIEDKDELQALLLDPKEMLALWDMARISNDAEEFHADPIAHA